MATSAERVRRKRALAREQGLCTRCCRVRPEASFRVCNACKDFIKAHIKKRRDIGRQTPSQRISGAHERAGSVAFQHHFYAAAVQHFEDALSALPQGSLQRFPIELKLAEALTFGNEPTRAAAQYEHILNSYVTTSIDAAHQIYVLFQFAHQLGIAAKLKARVPVLKQALGIARRQHDPVMVRKASILIGNVLTQTGRYEEAKEMLDAIGEIPADDSEVARSQYWSYKGMISSAFGREEEAFDYFNRATQAVENTSNLYQPILVWSDFAQVAIAFGRMEFAKVCLERAIFTARKNNIGWFIPYACAEYAGVLHLIGEFELALEYIHDALSSEAQVPILDICIARIGIPLAIHVADDAVLESCKRCDVIDLVFQAGDEDVIGQVAAAFASLHMKEGRANKARALLHRALKTIKRVVIAWDLPLAVARFGKPSDIPRARMLLESRARLRGSRVANACLCLFDAFVAQREGRMGEARATAKDALVRLEAMHFIAYADLARTILPMEKPLSNGKDFDRKPFSSRYVTLTEREREIAALVLKGLTSRAIASKLSISPHTVDSHVTSIMSRLSIRSRHELAYVLPEAHP